MKTAGLHTKKASHLRIDGWLFLFYQEKMYKFNNYIKPICTVFLVCLIVLFGHATSLRAEGELCQKAFERRDYHTAFLSCRKAAEKDPQSQFFLGSLYQKGLGVEQDIPKAIRLFQRAADKGFLPAHTKMGDIFSGINGGSKNYKEAVYWYKKAADKDDPEAQLKLGHMIAHGRGEKKNQAVGYMWVSLAANKGLKQAQQELVLLKKQLPSEAVEKGRQLLKERKNTKSPIK